MKLPAAVLAVCVPWPASSTGVLEMSTPSQPICSIPNWAKRNGEKRVEQTFQNLMMHSHSVSRTPTKMANTTT